MVPEASLLEDNLHPFSLSTKFIVLVVTWQIRWKNHVLWLTTQFRIRIIIWDDSRMHAALISAWLHIHLVGIQCILGKRTMCRRLIEKELTNCTWVNSFKQWNDFDNLSVD